MNRVSTGLVFRWLCFAVGEVVNHFSTKALRGDREGVMNLALTAALLGGGRRDESRLYWAGAIFRKAW
jgi:hypothetical protein